MVSLYLTGPNWGIVSDFNLSPVRSAPAKHNTAPGSFQCRPGKQLWMKEGDEEVWGGMGWGGVGCVGVALPLDKHSLDGVISHLVPFGILWLGNHWRSQTFST